MGSTVTSARVAGALLVERGLVTPAQLAEALEHQRAHGGELDEILPQLFDVPTAEVTAALHDRDGAPEQGYVALLMPDGRRAWGATTDPDLMKAMTTEDLVGRSASIVPDGSLTVD